MKNHNAFATKYFFDIQVTALTILQYRRTSIEKRLIILGILSNKLSDLFVGKETKSMEELLEFFGDADVLDTYSEKLDESVSPMYLQQLTMLRDMSINMLRSTNVRSSQRYLSYLMKAVNNLFKSEDNDEVVRNYKEDGLSKYRDFMERKSYVVENYLVNVLFEQAYPLSEGAQGKKNNVFNSYARFALNFVMLRTLITGLLMSGMELNDDEIVAVLQSFAKKVNHSETVVNNVIKSMQANESYTVAGMVLLLNI